MLLRTLRQTLNVLALTAALAVGVGAAWLHIHGGQLLSVQTGSMTPVIDKGDMVVITRIPARQLAVGDVVTHISTFNGRQTTLTHRIIRINGDKITTKGDANAVSDPIFDASLVVGKVQAHVPRAGFALDFTRKPLGLFLLLYVPALSIVIAEMRRLSAAYKRERPYFAPGTEARLRAKLREPINWRAVSMTLCSLASAASLLLAHPAQAALTTPTVVLKGTTIATGILHNRTGCTSSSNTTIQVQNSSSQTATTGNASGSSASSGNASSTNSTSTQITITNC